MNEAFRRYTKQNNKRPEQIVVFRGGVGGPSYQTKVISNEGAGS